MSIGASIVCVADGKMPGLIAALRAGIRYPVIEMRPEDAPTRLAAIQPGAAPEQPTVLVAGRGGGYPALTLAVGERAGLIGALGFETAQRYLDGRDIDGIVVGDGFSGRAVEGFLDTLRSDVRFRDLPIV